MINVKTDLHSYISIEGHAGYAPAGSDIVCAAVSILYETLKRILVLPMEAKFTEDEDSVQIDIHEEYLSVAGYRYLSFFLTGIEALEQAYPKHVQLYRAIKRA